MHAVIFGGGFAMVVESASDINKRLGGYDEDIDFDVSKRQKGDSTKNG